MRLKPASREALLELVDLCDAGTGDDPKLDGRIHATINCYQSWRVVTLTDARGDVEPNGGWVIIRQMGDSHEIIVRNVPKYTGSLDDAMRVFRGAHPEHIPSKPRKVCAEALRARADAIGDA